MINAIALLLIAKAYVFSLGVLYYKVPGSPIGFGDKDRVGALLCEALALDSNGLDANYFWRGFSRRSR